MDMETSPHISPMDAPSLVFVRLAGTCSLNHSHHYALGRRHPPAAQIRRDLRVHR